MNESIDRALDDWLHEKPQDGTREGLERTLAATRRVGQRPGWTFPERWLPMQLTMTRTQSLRPILAIVLLALLIAASVGAALFVGSQLRQPPSPFRNGAIVFERNGDLFIADQPGGAPRPLVVGPDRNSLPVFSEDGSRIAFFRETRDGTFVMATTPDGSRPVELASLDRVVTRLAWAPDGSALLASTHAIGGDEQQQQLEIIEADGSGVRTLDVGPVPGPESASWQPVGRQIFVQMEDDAFVVDADGTTVRRLPVGSVGGRAWSPDGRHFYSVAIGRDMERKTFQDMTITDVDADGEVIGSHQLPRFETDAQQAVLGRTWSPDSSRVAVLEAALWIADVGGSIRRIDWPGVGLDSAELVWSPDGRSLAIMGTSFGFDPAVTGQYGYDEKSWLVDVATGQWTELQTPIESWQRLAP